MTHVPIEKSVNLVARRRRYDMLLLQLSSQFRFLLFLMGKSTTLRTQTVFYINHIMTVRLTVYTTSSVR